MGGLYSVPMWGAMDGYTLAQIELMLADAPLVVYDKSKGDKAKQENKPKAIDLHRSILKYEQKQASGGSTFSLAGFKIQD